LTDGPSAYSSITAKRQPRCGQHPCVHQPAGGLAVLLRRRREKEGALERDARVRSLDHHKTVDVVRRRELARMANSGTLASARTDCASSSRSSARKRVPVAEERDQHAAFDLVVLELLMQVDFERTIRDEDDVLGQQPRCTSARSISRETLAARARVHAAAAHRTSSRRKCGYRFFRAPSP
jgi:hypothetical protein